MQLQKTTPAGEFSGITEMSVLSNQQYLDAAIEASKEGDGFHVVLGMNLEDPANPHEPTSQEFMAFISQGIIVNHKFDLA